MSAERTGPQALPPTPAGWPSPSDSRLTWALFYASKGWPVFPLMPFRKIPYKGSRGLLDATTDVAQITEWWQGAPRANIGIATGPVVIVDEDSAKGGDASPLLLPLTLTVITWSGGRHFYYTPPQGHEIHNSTDKLAPHVDVRGTGGYVVAPPSIVSERGATGNYRWDDPSWPVAELPRRLVELLTPEPEPARPAAAWGDLADPITVDVPGPGGVSTIDGAHWLDKALAMAREGNRNDTGLWLACQLRDSGLDEQAAEPWQLAYAEQVPGDDYTITEAMASLRQSYRKPAREPARSKEARSSAKPNAKRVRAIRLVEQAAAAAVPGSAPPGEETAAVYRNTEFGNTDRLLAAHGDELRYTGELGWLAWDGSRWRPNAEIRVREWSVETIRQLYAQASADAAHAAASESVAQRKALGADAVELINWAGRSETDKMITAMVSLARSSCHVPADVFDGQPYLLNVGNGTLDLHTGQLSEPRPDDLLTQGCSTIYDPAAQCPTFLRFLREIMCDRADLVEYMQRALGYSLTGDVREQVWHLCVGEGANGKSTLFETIEYVIGEYAATVAPETITLSSLTRDGAAPSPDIARMKGKRFAKITETEEGARIAPARIKSLSGGDMVMGRHLHRDIVEFRPTLKIWIYTNHRPQVRETTHAFWRRVRFVPFDFSARDNADPGLADKLRAEAPGILAWLVRGCMAWQSEGLNPPAAVLEATASYRADQDILAAFLDERCELHPQYTVESKQLYAAYVEWCEEAGERPQSQRRLSSALQERGLQRQRGHGWEWLGVRLGD